MSSIQGTENIIVQEDKERNLLFTGDLSTKQNQGSVRKYECVLKKLPVLGSFFFHKLNQTIFCRLYIKDNRP